MTHQETLEQVDGGKPRRQSKLEKKQKNLYLSAQARQLLTALSWHMGISETAVVELLVREKAARENIAVPPKQEPGQESRQESAPQ